QFVALRVRVELDTRIVPRRDLRSANGIRHLQKLVKLDEVVTQRAWDWSAAGEILIHERLHYFLLELLFEVDDVVWNAKLRGDAPGVVNIVERTAAPGCFLGCEVGEAALVPKLHGHPDNRVAVTQQHARNRGTVDASGHGHQYSFRHMSSPHVLLEK